VLVTTSLGSSSEIVCGAPAAYVNPVRTISPTFGFPLNAREDASRVAPRNASTTKPVVGEATALVSMTA
jgi:hypothetical protein